MPQRSRWPGLAWLQGLGSSPNITLAMISTVATERPISDGIANSKAILSMYQKSVQIVSKSERDFR